MLPGDSLLDDGELEVACVQFLAFWLKQGKDWESLLLYHWTAFIFQRDRLDDEYCVGVGVEGNLLELVISVFEDVKALRGLLRKSVRKESVLQLIQRDFLTGAQEVCSRGVDKNANHQVLFPFLILDAIHRNMHSALRVVGNPEVKAEIMSLL